MLNAVEDMGKQSGWLVVSETATAWLRALPAAAVAVSLGFGNPTAVAELRAGERVLDLGSGGGIDVLSARRVGPSGFAYGVDMTDEMLALAEANKAKSGLDNVAFLKGAIEDVPLPGGAVDVGISNCVSTCRPTRPPYSPRCFASWHLVAASGSPTSWRRTTSPPPTGQPAARTSAVSSAVSRREYLDGLAAAGFADADVTFTHEVAPGMHGAIVRATKPLC